MKSGKEDKRSESKISDRSRRKGSKPKKAAHSNGKAKKNTREEDVTDRRSSVDPINDFSWYNKYPELLTAAGSLPFPIRPGMAVSVMDNSGTSVAQQRIPGVAAIYWAPSIGKAQDATDPANILGREYYGAVRDSFSGKLYADAPDFVIYNVCLDSVFSYIAYLKRIYRITMAYTPMNFAIPEELVAAMNIAGSALENLKVLQQNRVKLWQYINELIHMTSKLKCPAVMDYFNRHYWMNDNVYTDTGSINSQMYVFVQEGWFKYTMLNTPDSVLAGGAAMVQPSFMTTSQGSNLVESMYNFGLDLINALAESEDAYTISGYLQRAFEGVPNFVVEPLGQDEQLTPAYEPEVLAQIENTRILPLTPGFAVSSANFNISQDPNANVVLHNPKITVATSSDAGYTALSQGYIPAPLLNIRSDVPTLQEIVVASRMHAIPNNFTITENSVTYEIECGTEIPFSMTLFSKTPTGSLFSLVVNSIVDLSDIGVQAISPVQVGWLRAMVLSSAFDWFPITAFTLSGKNPNAGLATMWFGDLHNANNFSIDELANLHKICIYSELNAFNVH